MNADQRAELCAKVGAATLPGQSLFRAEDDPDGHVVALDWDGKRYEICRTEGGHSGHVAADGITAALNVVPALAEALDAAVEQIRGLQVELAGTVDAAELAAKAAAEELTQALLDRDNALEAAEGTANRAGHAEGRAGVAEYDRTRLRAEIDTAHRALDDAGVERGTSGLAARIVALRARHEGTPAGRAAEVAGS